MILIRHSLPCFNDIVPSLFFLSVYSKWKASIDGTVTTTILNWWLFPLEVGEEVNLLSLWCLHHILFCVIVWVVELLPVLFCDRGKPGGTDAP